MLAGLTAGTACISVTACLATVVLWAQPAFGVAVLLVVDVLFAVGTICFDRCGRMIAIQKLSLRPENHRMLGKVHYHAIIMFADLPLNTTLVHNTR